MLFKFCLFSVVVICSGFLHKSKRIENIKLRYYSGSTVAEYIDIPLSQASTLLGSKGFVKNAPTVLYVHGYIEVPTQESIQTVVSAYLEARPETNVVLLDWSNMAHGSYFFNAALNTKKVGDATAVQLNALFNQGLSLEQFRMVGFSLGCHVVGYTARALKYTYSKTVKRITVLDPARPGYYPGLIMHHVAPTDAEFVDVIHTDAGHYGAQVATGTADFWPNGGTRVQPGCPLFAPIFLSPGNLCSHWRAWRYYAESVRNPRAFPTNSGTNTFMGYGCDVSARGSYYLSTNAQSPFGQGM